MLSSPRSETAREEHWMLFRNGFLMASGLVPTQDGGGPKTGIVGEGEEAGEISIMALAGVMLLPILLLLLKQPMLPSASLTVCPKLPLMTTCTAIALMTGAASLMTCALSTSCASVLAPACSHQPDLPSMRINCPAPVQGNPSSMRLNC